MSEDPVLSKAEARTQAQRERILSAALSCFVERGFHAASMATIAETAGMSPGLIYRYFDSKDAIILAIIDRQLEIARGRIRELHASNDLVAGILEHFEEHDVGGGDSMSAALFLEMSAESTRNPAIAASLGRFDAMVRDELADWFGRSKEHGGHGLPKKVATERALMLVCLIEGLKVRRARDPGIDRTMLGRGVETFVDTLTARDDGRSRS